MWHRRLTHDTWRVTFCFLFFHLFYNFFLFFVIYFGSVSFFSKLCTLVLKLPRCTIAARLVPSWASFPAQYWCFWDQNVCAGFYFFAFLLCVLLECVFSVLQTRAVSSPLLSHPLIPSLSLLSFLSCSSLPSSLLPSLFFLPDPLCLPQNDQYLWWRHLIQEQRIVNYNYTWDIR